MEYVIPQEASILHMKCRAVLGVALAAVVETGSAHIGVSEPLLHFGNVSLV